MKKCIAFALALAPLMVQAQYPERPIKLVVRWPAGGDTDNIFRPFAPLMQKHVGQTVVIANVGGASGTKGAKELTSAQKEDHTRRFESDTPADRHRGRRGGAQPSVLPPHD